MAVDYGKDMNIDCSKISNKTDLLALVGMVVIVALLAIAVLLAVYVDNFWAGFFSATITWKWHDWIYKPIDRLLDKLWPPDEAI
jgi:divalent metal cation (Fe/Co/Zn/Cd) transporter